VFIVTLSVEFIEDTVEFIEDTVEFIEDTVEFIEDTVEFIEDTVEGTLHSILFQCYTVRAATYRGRQSGSQENSRSVSEINLVNKYI
jgi:prophage DNA circulation protein